METNTLVILGITTPGKLACIARSRTYSQFVGMVEDALAGRCTMCTPPPRNKMIEVPEVRLWQVWHCNPPEKNTSEHLIYAPRRHVTAWRQLYTAEKLEMLTLWDLLPGMFDMSFCGHLMRDGDATKSAGTQEHLHGHMMKPAGTGRVESPFCKTPEEEAASLARAIIFAKVYAGTPFEALSEEEKTLVADRMK